ncbi:ABC-2 transporter permease [Paenibacillus sp. FSL E2-0201]|uniref:ABC-2 transporter permease n=1 Tax=Paenibacillus sp. FSL E2-0201 TaxID=2954726 RepID=UPI0030DA47A4
MYHSFYLIRKDFILLRKLLMLLIPFFIFIAYSNYHSFSLFTVMPPMLLLISSCSMDTQQMTQRFLVNLPVRRQELVRAKYFSILPYALVGLAATAFTYLLIIMTGKEVTPHFWQEVGITIAIFPLLAMLYLPIHYWLGAKGAQVVNLVFMMIIMVGPNVIGSLLQWFPDLENWQSFGVKSSFIPYIVLGLAYVFLLSCSYLISLRIFEKKDL